MIRRSFGKHIHSQIIWPLAVSAIIVAIGATIVAVNVIGTMTVHWIDDHAEDTAFLVTSRLDRRSAITQGSLELLATDPRLMDAVRSGDPSGLREVLSLAGRALNADSLMLLDADGRVVTMIGGLPIARGDRPLGGDGARAVDSQEAPLVARVGDGYAVIVRVPVSGPGGSEWSLASASAVDDNLMADLDVGVRAGIIMLDSGGEPIASAMPDNAGDFDPVASIPSESLAAAVQNVSSGSDVPEGVGVRVAGDRFRIIARELRFSNAPSGESLFLVTVVDTRIAQDAMTVTARLIALWVALSIASLLALNGYIARKVSRPLTTLSASVARVAGGDFSARVEIAGTNEIADLADDFNRMTVSLKERSDSLTKKVLELATLYEMSRSLGATLELETLLDSVLDSAMRIFDVELGYVTMVDRESGALEVRIWRGVDLSHAGETSVRSSMSDWVVREGRPLIFNPPVNGGGSEDAGGHSDAVSGAIAALCVPLLSNEGTIGAITVGTRNPSQRFTSDDVRLLATIANHVTIAVGNISLFSSVQEAYLATVRALAAAVDAKDPYTRGHSDGVAAYALMIGEAMGLSGEQMIALEMAAYLHDIGKIGISEDILLKPGKLTDAEMGQMRHHPLIGANILKPVAFPWPIAPIVRHHHEHFNGQGYPAGLRSEEIPVLARVLTVADAFEAMVADRPYRRGRSQQEAILELRRCAGTHFDPRVVDSFVGLLERIDTGTADVFPLDEDLGPEETQAVLVAVCDGMFASFRRLGGPRLANNLERASNQEFESRGVPLSLHAGHLSVEGEAAMTDEELVDHLRCAIGVISESIERASGAGLADHFLAEALAGLPERLRVCAGRLGFASAT